MRIDAGYGAVWAERPVRGLLLCSLGGRTAFSMLPLGFVLFATAQTHSSAAAGALVAAFSVASSLMPARGRVVDRRGPQALVVFALGCAGGLAALTAAGMAGASPAALVALGALAGLVVPPLGPFTRAVLGTALHERHERLQRAFALDSAGEEGALIVAPLLVAAVVAAASPAATLLVAAAGLLGGAAGTARNPLTAELRPPAAEASARVRLPLVLWLVFASLLGPGAALGTLNVAVPSLTRAAGEPATAGLLLAALATGTASASLLAGRRAWRWPAPARLGLLQLVLSAALAAAAALSGRFPIVAAVLVVAGLAVGALFVTLYVLVDELTPAGAGTRSFAWLVTANNVGIALGAATGGALIAAEDGAAGLWLGMGFALAGVGFAAAVAAAS